MDQEETNLDQIMIVLENIEAQNLSQEPSIKNWLSNITHPDFKLIDSMINLFLDNILDLTLSKNILKVLRKLNMYQRDQILPQLTSNKKFPMALSEYITKNKPSDVSGDAFVLLGEIFITSSFKEVTTKKFVNSIFDAVSIIDDEDVFNSIVLILTQINFETKDNEENIFTLVFQDHENGRYLVEGLLRILNNTEDKKTTYRILKCFNDTMATTKDCLLYSSDLEAFIGLSIKKLETTTNEELRMYILNVLQQITIFDDYYKTKYKIDELIDILESYESSNDVCEENRTISAKILENINKH